jgi:hypothetical protein
MANQTSKSTEGNISNDKTTGQGSGASPKPAREANTSPGAGITGSPSAMSTNPKSTGSGSPSATGPSGSAGTAVEAAKDTAKNLIDQAKTTASDAYGTVAEKATTKLEEQKSTLAGGLTSVAESVRSMGDNLNKSPEANPLADYTAQYATTAARKLENVASYFERKDVKEMARDIENFARRNPAIFLGGAFALGILAARFFKSTPAYSGRSFKTGIDHQLPPAGTESKGGTDLRNVDQPNTQNQGKRTTSGGGKADRPGQNLGNTPRVM